jgi:hypothetical protein
MRGTHNVKIY